MAYKIIGVYTTREGDMLHIICQEQYGRQIGVLEKVMDANEQSGLVELGPVLPAGIQILLPEIPNRNPVLGRRLFS